MNLPAEAIAGLDAAWLSVLRKRHGAVRLVREPRSVVPTLGATTSVDDDGDTGR